MSLVYPDIPRVYTAIAEWLACMLYYLQVGKRFEGKGRNALLCLGFLTVQGLFLLYTGRLSIVFWLPCMLAAAVIMFLFIIAGCKVSVIKGAYMAAFAFAVAEFAASLEWQLHCFFVFRQGVNNAVLIVSLIVLIYGGLFTTFWFVERKWFNTNFSSEISRRELIAVLFIVAVVFAFSNFGFVSQNSPFSGQSMMDIFNVRTLIDMGGIAILYAYKSSVIRLYTEKELYSINSVLHLQYNKYTSFRDSMDILQIKCHDIKHQLLGLRTETDPGKRKEWLDVLDAELDLGEFAVYTGNSVLDSIISAKMLYGKRHGIKITCVADGRLLEFMHLTDICSIFGNALDNAIESVITLSNKERRMIHITVTSQKMFMLISVENYHESGLTASNDFPETTKSDKTNHGFGLKSIEYSAKKYGGEVVITTGGNKFEIRILIPYPLFL